MASKITLSLRNALERFRSIEDRDWSVMHGLLEVKTLRKGEELLALGEIPKGTWFVHEGALRAYRLRNGVEVHTGFYFEGDFVRELEGLSKGTPSETVLAALEHTEVIYLPKQGMVDLYKRAPVFEAIGKHLLEMMLVTERKYSTLFTDFRPKERYEYVLEHHPELVQRVPGLYLSTFLGITRESLSRIRGRLKN